MRATLLTIACAAAALLGGCEPALFDSPSALMPVAGWKGADVNSADAFRFVVLSDRTGGQEKGAWARAVAGARHVFLVMHHPLFGTRHWRRICHRPLQIARRKHGEVM